MGEPDERPTQDGVELGDPSRPPSARGPRLQDAQSVADSFAARWSSASPPEPAPSPVKKSSLSWLFRFLTVFPFLMAASGVTIISLVAAYALQGQSVRPYPTQRTCVASVMRSSRGLFVQGTLHFSHLRFSLPCGLSPGNNALLGKVSLEMQEVVLLDAGVVNQTLNAVFTNALWTQAYAEGQVKLHGLFAEV
jgi:hypothetical protein